jgi:hypothetical protein
MRHARSFTLRSAHLPRFFLPALTLALIACAPAAWAQEITRVEEDWELVVHDPDVATDAPQLSTVLSPFGHLESLYASFDFNHRSQPDFLAGGAQVQVWNGEQSLDRSNSNFTSKLQNAGETVTWTQVMKLHEGQLHFRVINGSSSSWGSFGNWPYLRVSVATSLSTLSDYDPAVSVDNSGVSYAGNRVTSLTLKRVRRYLANGELHDQITTPFVVHSN